MNSEGCGDNVEDANTARKDDDKEDMDGEPPAKNTDWFWISDSAKSAAANAASAEGAKQSRQKEPASLQLFALKKSPSGAGPSAVDEGEGVVRCEKETFPREEQKLCGERVMATLQPPRESEDFGQHVEGPDRAASDRDGVQAADAEDSRNDGVPSGDTFPLDMSVETGESAEQAQYHEEDAGDAATDDGQDRRDGENTPSHEASVGRHTPCQQDRLLPTKVFGDRIGTTDVFKELASKSESEGIIQRMHEENGDGNSEVFEALSSESESERVIRRLHQKNDGFQDEISQLTSTLDDESMMRRVLRDELEASRRLCCEMYRNLLAARSRVRTSHRAASNARADLVARDLGRLVSEVSVQTESNLPEERVLDDHVTKDNSSEELFDAAISTTRVITPTTQTTTTVATRDVCKPSESGIKSILTNRLAKEVLSEENRDVGPTTEALDSTATMKPTINNHDTRDTQPNEYHAPPSRTTKSDVCKPSGTSGTAVIPPKLTNAHLHRILEEYQEHQRDLEAQLNTLRSQCREKDDRLVDLKEKLGGHIRLNAMLQSEKTCLEDTVGQLRQEIKSCDELVATCENLLETKDEEIRGLKGKTFELERQVAEAQFKEKELQQMTSNFQEYVADLAAQRKGLRKSVKESARDSRMKKLLQDDMDEALRKAKWSQSKEEDLETKSHILEAIRDVAFNHHHDQRPTVGDEITTPDADRKTTLVKQRRRRQVTRSTRDGTAEAKYDLCSVEQFISVTEAE